MKIGKKRRMISALLVFALVGSLVVPAYAVVSEYDQKYLSLGDKLQIYVATKQYEKAESEGNQAGMDAAHAKAEAVRATANYSGGTYGNEYNPWDTGSSSSSTSSGSSSSGSSSGSGSSGGSSSGGSSSGGGSSGGGSSYTPPITYYSITASAGDHGSISPSGTASVASGGSKTYTITPVYGYAVDAVKINGTSVGALTSYTFSSVSSNQTIAATFKSLGSVTVGDITVKDQTGSEFTTFKAGYGFEANLDMDIQYATITSATATMSNGDTCQLELVNGDLQFVVNPQSPIGARKYYVPVSTQDGTFTCTFTVTSVDTEGVALPTVTKTISFTIKGTMYEDDYTGGA